MRQKLTTKSSHPEYSPQLHSRKSSHTSGLNEILQKFKPSNFEFNISDVDQQEELEVDDSGEQ